MDEAQFRAVFDGKLYPRQKEVLELFLGGLSDGDIAAQLHLEACTIRKHITNLCNKFNLRDTEGERCRNELIHLFIDFKPEWVCEKYKQRFQLQQSEPKPVLNFPSGPVDVDSPFYIKVPDDEQWEEWVEDAMAPGGLIRIRAPRRMGKTSLLNRVLVIAKNEGFQTIYLNLQHLDRRYLANSDQFLQRFLSNVINALHLSPQLDSVIHGEYGYTEYFQATILNQVETPLMLALDNVDTLFEYPDVAKEFFSFLRGWHEIAKNPGREIWKKLRLLISHATDAYIKFDINRSPFENVGVVVKLPQFNQQQVQKLAQLYQLNLVGEQIEHLMAMIGGHPYLVQLAFYSLHKEKITLEQLLELAPTQQGIYKNHLKDLWEGVYENAASEGADKPTIVDALKQVLESKGNVRLEQRKAFKLEGMGLVQFQGNQVKITCELYRRYFQDWLLDD